MSGSAFRNAGPLFRNPKLSFQKTGAAEWG